MAELTIAGFPASYYKNEERNIYGIDLDIPGHTCYIEAKLSGRKSKGLVITGINVPPAYHRRGIGSALVSNLRRLTGTRRVYAYNVRIWGSAGDFFTSLGIPEIFSELK